MRRFACLCLGLLLLVGLPTRARATTWALSPIDPTDNAGWTPSLRLDAQGLPRVAYWMPFVRYAEYDGTQWHVEVAQPPAALPFAGAGAVPPDDPQLIRTVSTALALDAAGNPWIAHTYNDADDASRDLLQVTTRQGGVWSTEDLEIVSTRPAIEVDAAGVVHVFYGSPLGLRHASRVAGLWAYETIDPNGGTPSTALDSQGRLHIAYDAGSPAGIRHAVLDAGAWQTELVDTTAGVGGPTLALDAQDRPRIAYARFQGPGVSSLRYAERQGADWSTQEVTVAGTQAGAQSLALAADGSPLVSYYSFDVGQLRVLTRAAGVWSTQTVDGQGNAGQNSSVAFDAAGAALIAYKGSLNPGLRLAKTAGLTAVGLAEAAPRLRIVACAPNPAHRGVAVSLMIDSPRAEQASIEAFDVTGRRSGPGMLRALASGRTRLEWTPRSASGICFLRVRSASGHEAVARIAVMP